MKDLEKREDKIQKIADDLRHKTLEPAKQEAERIIESAKKEAEQIIKNAQKKSVDILSDAQQKVVQERSVFESSLSQASKQTIEALKQSIEKNLFSSEIEKLVDKNTADPQVIAQLITSIVQAIDKEGLDVNLSAVVSKNVSIEKVNALLADAVLKKLKDHSVELGDFQGGVQVKLNGKHITLDMSDKAIREILANYVRKDFRKYLFSS